MQTLITGATGFTGSHLAYRLILKGHNVTCLVRPTSNYTQLEKAGCKIIFGDVRDRLWIEKVINEIDIIFHLAAIFRTWGLPNRVYYETHVEGTRNLLEVGFKKNIKKFIHCSTIGVHGSIKNPPGNENSPFNPGDIYQRTKLEAEQLALKYYKEKNLPVVVIRPTGIYGPGDMRFLKLFSAIAKKRFIMIGNGKTLWHPVYIDDLITGFELAMNTPKIEGETFIIGGPEYLTINTLVTEIAKALGVSPPNLSIPAKPVQILGTICELIYKPFGINPPIFRSRVDFFTKNRDFSINKAREKIGYIPKYDIINGIRLTIEWYKTKGLI